MFASPAMNMGDAGGNTCFELGLVFASRAAEICGRRDAKEEVGCCNSREYKDVTSPQNDMAARR